MSPKELNSLEMVGTATPTMVLSWEVASVIGMGLGVGGTNERGEQADATY